MHSAKTNDSGCRESVTLLRKYLRLNDDAALFELVGKCCVYLYFDSLLCTQVQMAKLQYDKGSNFLWLVLDVLRYLPK